MFTNWTLSDMHMWELLDESAKNEIRELAMEYPFSTLTVFRAYVNSLCDINLTKTRLAIALMNGGMIYV